jgi:hypothetical protein
MYAMLAWPPRTEPHHGRPNCNLRYMYAPDPTRNSCMDFNHAARTAEIFLARWAVGPNEKKTTPYVCTRTGTCTKALEIPRCRSWECCTAAPYTGFLSWIRSTF